MTSSPANEPAVDAIAERVRVVMARQPKHSLNSVAETLGIPADTLQQLLQDRGRLIDPVFLIDVIAALVREVGVDPQWLLTGEYDSRVHREALLLGEDRTSRGAQALREFIRAQYRWLRDTGAVLMFLGHLRTH